MTRRFLLKLLALIPFIRRLLEPAPEVAEHMPWKNWSFDWPNEQPRAMTDAELIAWVRQRRFECRLNGFPWTDPGVAGVDYDDTPENAALVAARIAEVDEMLWSPPSDKSSGLPFWITK